MEREDNKNIIYVATNRESYNNDIKKLHEIEFSKTYKVIKGSNDNISFCENDILRSDKTGRLNIIRGEDSGTSINPRILKKNIPRGRNS